MRALRNKKWFILALILTLLAAWGVFAYFGMTMKPIAGITITPSLHAEQWRFSLADETELSPNETGTFALPEGNTTLFCTISLAEYADSLTSSALLGLTSRSCDAAVFADGELIADPSHRFDETAGIFVDNEAPGGGSGLFTLGAAQELTIAVRFLAPDASLRALPSVTIYPEQYAYSTIYLTEGAKAALPAGVFLAAAMALVLLFLFQLYNKKSNPDVLLLALVSLSFCLSETITFGIYVVWFLKTPFVTYVLRLLPTLMILWILWYRCRGKVRRYGWLYPLIWTLAATAGIVWRQIDIVSGNQFTNLLQGKLLPLAMLIALLVCGWQAVRGNDAYRRFFAIGGVLAVCTGLFAIVSRFSGGEWWNTLQTAFRNTALLGYFEPLQLLNQFMLILLFLLAIYDFVMQIVRRNAELQALTLQNRYAAEHAEHLRRSLDETRAMRHEMRHHVDALKALITGGDIARAADYVGALGGDLCTEPARYADHALINALVSSCAQKSKILDAEFEASVQVPEEIGIDDTDLAVILSNMIDNALEALSAVPDKKDRRLHLTAAIFEDTGLFISCTNTFAGERKYDDAGNLVSTKTENGHGLGMKAMHRVAEKYNNILLPEITGNIFHVKTYLYFKK